MSQTSLNGRQARLLIYLAPYDFTIHYQQGHLNPADGPSRRPDYMDEKGPNTAVTRLILTLENKLITISSGAGEQCVKGYDPDAVSLIQALSMQTITQLVTKRVASKSYGYFNLSEETSVPNQEA